MIYYYKKEEAQVVDMEDQVVDMEDMVDMVDKVVDMVDLVLDMEDQEVDFQLEEALELVLGVMDLVWEVDSMLEWEKLMVDSKVGNRGRIRRKDFNNSLNY